MSVDGPSDEFGLIAKYFAPLAGKGGRGLKDDVAHLNNDIVTSKDVLVSGVHFFPEDPPDLIARKALRVNISDIVAKGVDPYAYMLGLVLTPETDERWVAGFAKGLAQDQEVFGVSLLGGDTTKQAAKGPIVVSLTIFGKKAVPGHIVHRDGAMPGDNIFVSGTIGDASLGLSVASGDLSMNQADMQYLLGRYRIPEPKHALATVVAAKASAALDVSDGLIADAGHLAKASGVGIALDASSLPLSDAAQSWCAEQIEMQDALVRLATGGDDYEILCAVKPSDTPEFIERAQLTNVAVTKIGTCTDKPAGRVKFMSSDGSLIKVVRAGYNHFRP
ncbi:MAG: thiamine-phosphate kinase [Aquisalinus sp.]|nr:thiamine-phosphate kinase [Aquisalinus sp.]